MGFSFNSFQAALKINYDHLPMKGEDQLSSLADSVNSKQKWKLRNTLGQSSGGFQDSQPFSCIFMCVAHFFSDTPAQEKVISTRDIPLQVPSKRIPKRLKGVICSI